MDQIIGRALPDFSTLLNPTLLSQAVLSEGIPGLRGCVSSDFALAVVLGVSGRNTPLDSHSVGSKQEL